MKSEFIFQTPIWYIVLCLIISILIAGFLYYKSSIEKKPFKVLLSVFRALSIFSILFILLNPLVKSVKNIFLKPNIVIALDNSQSINGLLNKNDVISKVAALKNQLNSNGFEVNLVDIAGNVIEDITKISFANPKTNLSQLFSTIKSNYDGQNLKDVILISDGIINEGVSPNNQKYNFSINTVGIGDTTAKRDVILVGISANKINFLGNKFTVNVAVNSYLYKNSSVLVSFKNDEGAILAKKSIQFKSNEDFQNVVFELTANKVGKHRFTAEVSSLDGEYSVKNNVSSKILETINGKQKVLLAANAPHPDIKFLKSVIDKNDILDLKIYFVDDQKNKAILNENYDAVILHHLPSLKNKNTDILRKISEKRIPTFYIIGSETNITDFNSIQNSIKISAKSGDFDKIGGVFNKNFNSFILDPKNQSFFSELPPIYAPFGNYALQNGTEPIMYQTIGNLATNRPLLMINRQNQNAVFAADGLWKWAMAEFQNNQKNVILDEIINKTIQLIALKQNKNNLKVYPVKDDFDINEKIIFETECYNDVFEKIYGQKINLKIKSENGQTKNYDYENTEEQHQFEVSDLKSGKYSYTANSSFLGKNYATSGEFYIFQSDLETQNTVANFNLLQNIAQENNGIFKPINEINAFNNSFGTEKAISKIVSRDELKELINNKWLLFLLILMLAAEWIIRKYLGVQ